MVLYKSSGHGEMTKNWSTPCANDMKAAEILNCDLMDLKIKVDS